MRFVNKLIITLSLLLLSGCGKDRPTAEKLLVFWHTQSDRKAKVLREIIRDYNASGPAIRVKEEFLGDYDTIYRKTLTSLMAGRPPDLAVAYESMVAEYMRYDAVVDLTPYLEEEARVSDIKEDIYPVFLESNRFQAFGGKLLSMPFTKSVLMLYYNVDMLEKIGRTTPPATWDEFLDACRKIKQQTGRSAYAFSRDASTFDAFVFSFGGEVYDPKSRRPLFDQAETLDVLKLHRDLFEAGLAHEVAYLTYDDRNDFAQARAAFFIRSSTSRPYVAELVKDKFRWDMAVIPRSKRLKQPRTVLFGANICMFKSNPARQKAAWNFIKYFISKEVTAKWSAHTGYLPVRKSALATATIKSFLTRHVANCRAIDAIIYARPEPNVRGWQEVRSVIERAISQVITGRSSPEQAAKKLQTDAQRILDSK